MDSSSKNRWLEASCYAFIVLAALVGKGWMLSPDNVFLMDDYAVLLRMATDNLDKHLRFLPSSIYSDRPVGNWFYYFVCHNLKLNHVATHAIQFALHVYGGCLAFYVLRRLGLGVWAALSAVFIFTAYPMSTMAVQWTASVYDLFCVTFSLTALALYAYDLHDRNRMKYFTPALVLFFYFLAVRSKEMAIFLPFILALAAVYRGLREGTFRELRRDLAVLVPAFVFFVVIFYSYLNLYFFRNAPVTTVKTSPYYISFSPWAMPQKIWDYVNFLYFGNNLTPLQDFLKAHRAPLVLGAGVAAAALWRLRPGALKALGRPGLRVLTVGGMFFFSLLIVLPIAVKNQYFLYFPSVFIAWLAAEALDPVFTVLLTPLLRAPAFAGLIVLLYGGFQRVDASPRFNRVTWLKYCARHRMQHHQFQASVTRLDGGENILVYNAKDGAEIFKTYGPGNSIKLYANLPKLTFDVLNEDQVAEVVKAKYDMVIRCNGGDLVFERLSPAQRKVEYLVKF